MSVLMTMVLDGDGEKLEQWAAENSDRIKAICAMLAANGAGGWSLDARRA